MIDLLFKNDIDFYNQKTKKLNQIRLQLKWGNPLKYNSKIKQLNKGILLIKGLYPENNESAFSKALISANNATIELFKTEIDIITKINKKAYEKNNDRIGDCL